MIKNIIILIVCSLLLCISTSCLGLYIYKKKSIATNTIATNTTTTNTTATNTTTTATAINTIIPFKSDLTSNFMIQTDSMITGQISDLNIIFNAEYLFKYYKLDKMYAKYEKIVVNNSALNYEYKIMMPPHVLNQKGIYAACDSMNFLDTLIFVLEQDATIIIFDKINNKTTNLQVTQNEKQRVTEAYKSFSL